jgi:predicted RNA-binding protein YlxR (DUF448 family)
VSDDGDDLEPETGPLRRCLITRERLPKERMIRFVLSPEQVVVPDLTARLPGRGIWLSARGDVVETARAHGSLTRAFAKHAAKGIAKVVEPDGAGNADAKPGSKVTRGLVTLTPDLSDLIEAMLLRRVVELMGLARRAGQAVCGFQKAREWLTSNRAGLVVQASDGSADERTRFLSGVTTMDLGAQVSPVVSDLQTSSPPEISGDLPSDADVVDGVVPREKRPKVVPVGSPLPAAALGAVFGRDHVVHVVVGPGRLAEALANEISRLSGVQRRPEPVRKNAKAGPKAAGGDAGKIEAGLTGQDHEMIKRAGA